MASGAGAALKDATSQGVKDAYRGLASLIRRRFQGKEQAENALEEYEASPEDGLSALKDQLVRNRVDQDAEILRAAQMLMARVDPSGMNAGKYRVQFAGSVQGVVIGDNAHVVQTFEQRSSET